MATRQERRDDLDVCAGGPQGHRCCLMLSMTSRPMGLRAFSGYSKPLSTSLGSMAARSNAREPVLNGHQSLTAAMLGPVFAEPARSPAQWTKRPLGMYCSRERVV